MTPISYGEARNVLAGLRDKARYKTEVVALHNALGRLSAKDILSEITTPQFDTSAMDGYAVRSYETQYASEATPVWLEVQGTIAAGHIPMILPEKGVMPFFCIEIMTGARFPEGEFDAVIPVEQTVRYGSKIRVTGVVKKDQHRRFAGSDFVRGECVVEKRTVIRSRHIMALASVGILNVPVLRIHAGVWSTGLEIINGMTNDANGPYLVAALREEGVNAEFAGVLPDHPQALVDALSERSEFDLVLTTGAVSAGKFDFIRTSLEMMNANVHFHHAAIRPGHPVLCASMGKVAFFGLPGNPIATAACMEFFVAPFLTDRTPVPLIQPQHAPASQVLDTFRHATITNGSVEMNSDQSPAKVKPFSRSSCWIHIQRNSILDDCSSCYLLS